MSKYKIALVYAQITQKGNLQVERRDAIKFIFGSSIKKRQKVSGRKISDGQGSRTGEGID